MEKRKRQRIDYQKYKDYDLSVLADLERAALLLRIAFDKMSTAELAALLKRSPASINAALWRASAKLDGRYDAESKAKKQREYIAANKEKKKLYNQQYIASHKEQMYKQKKEYYYKNRDRILEKQRQRKESKA